MDMERAAFQPCRIHAQANMASQMPPNPAIMAASVRAAVFGISYAHQKPAKEKMQVMAHCRIMAGIGLAYSSSRKESSNGIR